MDRNLMLLLPPQPLSQEPFDRKKNEVNAGLEWEVVEEIVAPSLYVRSTLL